MRVGVVSFPGSNCDEDALLAIVERLHEDAVLLWHKDRDLQGADVVILPGGFSYGDYLRSGAIARFSPIMQEVLAHARRGGPVIGICNGFQVLCESGLLPGVLLSNAGLKFICRDVHLKVANAGTMFTNRYRAGEVVRFPVAHHDGNYFADADTLKRIEDRGQIAFRYCTTDGSIVDGRGNPNGSSNNIAGVFNDTKTVLGLMPHPENAVEPMFGGTDGKALFEGMVEALS